ncbi:hypothetical protein LCGC14_1348110 [marine sediment metagenome]|uniref:Uncharacterized protein n=1 Tax=marine sediment metagenome TaxID=412755 RepID=A0A0F9KCA6_9ZZZZ
MPKDDKGKVIELPDNRIVDPNTGRIVVKENKRAPQGICPHCKRTLLLSLASFQEDMSSIMQTKCPLCGGDIFTACLVLVHGNPEGLANTIINMAAVVDADKVKYLGGD